MINLIKIYVELVVQRNPIVPTTTGAVKALTKYFRIRRKIGGCGIRVPVPDGS